MEYVLEGNCEYDTDLVLLRAIVPRAPQMRPPMKAPIMAPANVPPEKPFVGIDAPVSENEICDQKDHSRAAEGKECGEGQSDRKR